MKILLLSENQAVIGVVGICLDKPGFELINSFSENKECDLVIKDVEDEELNLDEFELKKTLFLLPKSKFKDINVKNKIVKPFLPTELIDFLTDYEKSLTDSEDIISKSAKMAADTGGDIESLNTLLKEIDSIDDKNDFKIDSFDNIDKKSKDDSLENSNMLKDDDEIKDGDADKKLEDEEIISPIKLADIDNELNLLNDEASLENLAKEIENEDISLEDLAKEMESSKEEEELDIEKELEKSDNISLEDLAKELKDDEENNDNASLEDLAKGLASKFDDEEDIEKLLENDDIPLDSLAIFDYSDDDEPKKELKDEIKFEGANLEDEIKKSLNETLKKNISKEALKDMKINISVTFEEK